MLVKTRRAVSHEFYLEKRVYILGLLHVFLRSLRQYFAMQTPKTCLHAVYYQLIAVVLKPLGEGGPNPDLRLC